MEIAIKWITISKQIYFKNAALALYSLATPQGTIMYAHVFVIIELQIRCRCRALQWQDGEGNGSNEEVSGDNGKGVSEDGDKGARQTVRWRGRGLARIV